MNRILLVVFGWLVPGGAYLLRRRYLQFGIFAAAVTVAVVLGFALQGASGWPRAEQLVGLDGFTAMMFRAGSAAKWLAGAPFLAASLIGGAGDFVTSRLHEYGSTLLIIAGVMNVLAVSSALDEPEA
jgi:hypothetical protein